MHQALAAAAAQDIGHSSADNTTGRVFPEQQPQHWHTHPQRCLASVCGTADLPRAQDAAAQGAQGGQQHHALFSVYVHTTDGMLLPRDSLFAGCELPVRLNTSQGYAQHVLADAGALLLAAALSDPLNAKFVLVSDTSIPLYPPQVDETLQQAERHQQLAAALQSAETDCCGVLCGLWPCLYWPPGPLS